MTKKEREPILTPEVSKMWGAYHRALERKNPARALATVRAIAVYATDLAIKVDRRNKENTFLREERDAQDALAKKTLAKLAKAETRCAELERQSNKSTIALSAARQLRSATNVLLECMSDEDAEPIEMAGAAPSAAGTQRLQEHGGGRRHTHAPVRTLHDPGGAAGGRRNS